MSKHEIHLSFIYAPKINLAEPFSYACIMTDSSHELRDQNFHLWCHISPQKFQNLEHFRFGIFRLRLPSLYLLLRIQKVIVHRKTKTFKNAIDYLVFENVISNCNEFCGLKI